MVAKIISGKSIRGALNYNENKVKQGKASCVLAHKFGSVANDLSFTNKFTRFQKLTERNPKVKTNALHISLNFDMSEKLEVKKLNAIAQTYMERIGFGEQPYLVYKHTDAAHPHIHIVSTLIQPNGKRKDIHNLGRVQSEKARKEIEKEFNLVPAESKSKKIPELQPIEPAKATYGKSETKRTISNTVRWVTQKYKYTSLPELNAVLQQFNVIADRGKDDTQMFRKKGLLYSLLDKNGKKIGIPIKASAIYSKPTLPWLEKQFKLNEALRQPFKEKLKQRIDKGLATGKGIAVFEKYLAACNTIMLLRQNDEGRIYGITFVDNQHKVVFNGSDLGKGYGAKAILERLNAGGGSGTGGAATTGNQEEFEISGSIGIEQVVTDLTEAKQFDYSLPEALKRKRKKKKRKGHSQ
ncbi:MAG TPA: relaxase/mobilization nuclease domain-containing protein [Cyclobacteriaceae bacterium]|nr:relaxase/mobilization nuclease domain-containing protein [Cyclobacteriaceae bacterium]HRF32384.1 relaxase/mobilization nuclease domain-containing protein [Cyclobacteriaceae bacterium]